MAAAHQNFTQRLDRFVRWFFTTSPTADLEAPPPAKRPAARRAESRRPPVKLRAHHAGPVRVRIEAKS